MALGWKLIVQILDDDGDYSTVSYKFNDTMTIDDVTGFADLFLPLIDNLIDGKIWDANIVFEYPLPGGLKVGPAALCDVEDGCQFLFHAGEYPVRNRVPTVVRSKYLTGSNEIDITDADVLAYTQAMTLGLLVGAVQVQPTDNRGADITAYARGVQNFRPR